MASCKYYYTLLALIELSTSGWVSITTPGLPRETSCMALGSYNDVIFILGGYGSSIYKQVVQYSATNQDFTDYGNGLDYNAYGGGDFYTQIDNTVYMLSGSGANLNAFDMTNRVYTGSWKPVSTPVSYTGCLTSASISNIDYIFVVGGYSESGSSVLDTVQVLKTSNMQWLSGIPSMKTARNRLSCIVDPSTLQLYAIAGKNGAGSDPASYLKSIEKINVMGMDQNEWEIIPATLTQPAIGTRSILYEERILVIGGRYANGVTGQTYLDTVHVIDPQTDSVTLPYASLPRGVAEAAAIIMNHELYVFGGSICPTKVDFCYDAYSSYLLFQFPTPFPTAGQIIAPTSTSHAPTYIPTTEPTLPPITSPTSLPTLAPTYNPILVPTDTPTGSPTYTPTLLPTLPPTHTPSVLNSPSPTGSPSNVPTLLPSNHPTLPPVTRPTALPTDTSTFVPTDTNTQMTQYPSQAPQSIVTTSNNPTRALTAQTSKRPSVRDTGGSAERTERRTTAQDDTDNALKPIKPSKDESSLFIILLSIVLVALIVMHFGYRYRMKKKMERYKESVDNINETKGATDLIEMKEERDTMDRVSNTTSTTQRTNGSKNDDRNKPAKTTDVIEPGQIAGEGLVEEGAVEEVVNRRREGSCSAHVTGGTAKGANVQNVEIQDVIQEEETLCCEAYIGDGEFVVHGDESDDELHETIQ